MQEIVRHKTVSPAELHEKKVDHVEPICVQVGDPGQSEFRSPILPTVGGRIPMGTTSRYLRWRRWIRHWKPTLEAVGIVGALFYAFVTYRQWQDLQGNFRAEQRAWIKPEFSWPPRLDATAKLKVTGRMTNTGKAIVTRMTSHGWLEIVPATSGPSFSGLPYHSMQDNPYLYPAEPSDFPIVLWNPAERTQRSLTTPELQSLEAGKTYLTVYGIVEYEDQFGPHWTRFCSWNAYVTDASFQSDSCVRWNQAGDGPGPSTIKP